MQNAWMRNLPRVALTLAVVVALLPINFAFAQQSGTFEILVTISGTDTPIADVTVQLLDTDGNVIATAVTNDQGIAQITDVAFGQYQVNVVAPAGYVGGGGPLVSFAVGNISVSVEVGLELLAIAAAAGGVSGWIIIAVVAAGGATIGTIVVLTGSP